MSLAVIARIRGTIGRYLGGESEEPVGIPEGVEPAGTDLDDLSRPDVIENDPLLAVACERCGEVFPTYWGWYNHLGEERLTGLDAAQADAQIVIVSDSGGNP